MDSILREAINMYKKAPDKLSAAKYWLAFCHANPGYSLAETDLNCYKISKKLKLIKIRGDEAYRQSHRKGLLQKFIHDELKSYIGQDVFVNNSYFFGWNQTQKNHSLLTEERSWLNKDLSKEERIKAFKDHYERQNKATKISFSKRFNSMDAWTIWGSDSFRRITEYWASKADNYTFESLWE